MKLGYHSRGLVDQTLEFGEARMAGIRAVVHQVRLAALFDDSCAQQRQKLPSQAAGTQPGCTCELAKIELALRQDEQHREKPGPRAPEEQLGQRVARSGTIFRDQ